MKLSCLAAAGRCDAEETLATKQSLGLIFNFHQSVYRQAKASGISKEFQQQMADDFCQSFDRKEAREFWDAQVKSGNYRAERVAMREQWCR